MMSVSHSLISRLLGASLGHSYQATFLNVQVLSLVHTVFV